MRRTLFRSGGGVFTIILIAAISAACTGGQSAPTPPTLASFSPARGPVGAKVVVTGSGFTSAKAVSFNGTEARFTVDTDRQITAVVPRHATTGSVSVVARGGTATGTSPFTVQPNVVFILTDDQRYDMLRRMPTVMGGLVDRGVRFANGFVVNPLCCPSRTSILTGQYSHTTGVWRNIGPDGGFPTFHSDGSTIATWLHGAGYRTALIGKYLNNYGPGNTYIPPGWDRWTAFENPGTGGDYYGYQLNVGGRLVSYGNGPADYSTDVLAAGAVGFIRTTPTSRPLFLYFAPFAPHGPTIPAPRDVGAFSGLAPLRPPSFNERDVSDKPLFVRRQRPLTVGRTATIDVRRERAFESLLAVDDAVGRILAALRDTGRLRDTLVLFMSDNGYLLGEHRLVGKDVPYEESIRVPFAVRWDRLQLSPRTDRHLILNVDVAPTIAAAAGVPAPGVEGANFLPVLTEPGASWRSRFLIESVTRGGYCGVHTSRGQIFVHWGTGEEELYILSSDPYQLNNQARSAVWRPVVRGLRSWTRQHCTPRPPGMPAF